MKQRKQKYGNGLDAKSERIEIRLRKRDLAKIKANALLEEMTTSAFLVARGTEEVVW